MSVFSRPNQFRQIFRSLFPLFGTPKQVRCRGFSRRWRDATRQSERKRRGAASSGCDVHQRRADDDGRAHRASEVQVRAMRDFGPARVSRASRRCVGKAFAATEAHPFFPAHRRDHPSAPHPPDLRRRPLAGSTLPSVKCPVFRPARTPSCSRWCAPADVSRDRPATRRPLRPRRANVTFLLFIAAPDVPDPEAHTAFRSTRHRRAEGRLPCRPRARSLCRSRTGSRGGSRETPAPT